MNISNAKSFKIILAAATAVVCLARGSFAGAATADAMAGDKMAADKMASGDHMATDKMAKGHKMRAHKKHKSAMKSDHAMGAMTGDAMSADKK